MNTQSSFTKWFDGQGHFIARPFQQWLATEIPLIGGADPSNVIPQASSDDQVKQGDPSVLQTALEGNSEKGDGIRSRATPNISRKART